MKIGLDKCYYVLLILLFGCNDMPIQVEEKRRISLRIIGEIEHDAWIKIDSHLFVHKKDFDNEEGPLRDSVLSSGEKFQYYVLPASKRYYKLHDGTKKVEDIIPLLVFNRMIMDIDIINKTTPSYKMNIGANLWLNNVLELTHVNNKTIRIEVPIGYPMTFDSHNN